MSNAEYGPEIVGFIIFVVIMFYSFKKGRLEESNRKVRKFTKKQLVLLILFSCFWWMYIGASYVIDPVPITFPRPDFHYSTLQYLKYTLFLLWMFPVFFPVIQIGISAILGLITLSILYGFVRILRLLFKK